MEKKQKKVMTIEDLAGMVKRGFDKTDEHFAHLEQRVGNVENRMGELEHELKAEMKKMKTDIVAAVNAIRDVKIENLEKDVEAIKKKIGLPA